MIPATSRRGFLVAAIGGLAACVDPADDGSNRVGVAPGVAFALPAPASLGRKIEAQQLIEARRNDQQVAAFEARLAVDNRHLLLVATDMLGRRALTVTWDGHVLKSEAASWVPEAMRARNMLGDIVLLFWPQTVLQPLLAATGARLEDTPQQRRIRTDNRDIVQIRYEPDQPHAWAGRTHYRNLAWGYELDVRSSEIAS